jgi:hypothetical protein
MSAQRVVVSMSAEDFEAAIRRGVRAEFEAAGLILEEPEHREQARLDFLFLRGLRKRLDGAASAIGRAVLFAAVAGLIALLMAGAKIHGIAPPTK